MFVASRPQPLGEFATVVGRQPLHTGKQRSLQIAPDRAEVARDGFCVPAGPRRRSKLSKPAGIPAQIQQTSGARQT
jgi:hypothetical protein